MSEDGGNATRSAVTAGEREARKADDQRETRSIRFSESAWKEIRRAARAHGLPTAEFVRERVLALGCAGESAAVPAVAPSAMAMVELMFRYTWFLATEKRDAILREGRGEELEERVAEARAFQESLRRSDPD